VPTISNFYQRPVRLQFHFAAAPFHCIAGKGK